MFIDLELKSSLKSKITLTQGVWNPDGTTADDITTRCRSTLIYDLQDYSKAVFPSGYLGRGFYWTDQMIRAGDDGFLQEIDLTAWYDKARYFAIIKEANNADIDSTQYDAISDGIGPVGIIALIDAIDSTASSAAPDSSVDAFRSISSFRAWLIRTVFVLVAPLAPVHAHHAIMHELVASDVVHVSHLKN